MLRYRFTITDDTAVASLQVLLLEPFKSFDYIFFDISTLIVIYFYFRVKADMDDFQGKLIGNFNYCTQVYMHACFYTRMFYIMFVCVYISLYACIWLFACLRYLLYFLWHKTAYMFCHTGYFIITTIVVIVNY